MGTDVVILIAFLILAVALVAYFGRKSRRSSSRTPKVPLYTSCVVAAVVLVWLGAVLVVGN